MPNSSRLAIGTIQPGVDRRPMMWALTEVLRRQDLHVQGFLSRAALPEHAATAVISGSKLRYLDSWLMDEAVCRELFVHGSEPADVSLVEGEFCRPTTNSTHAGGQLEPLCEWLGLPRIVLLDAAKIVGGLPRRPARLDGVMLLGVNDERHLARLATDIQTVWRVGVLGSLPATGRFSERIDGLLPGSAPPADLIRELGDCLSETWDPEVLHRLAQREKIPPGEGKLFQSTNATFRLTVAVAFDEAFDRYFPCALDLLDARGATVVDFSPLHDEHLPADCDIVLMGGGHPERHAATLADNHCMKTALRNHVRWGRRIYGEGGGIAFLCQQMVTPDGEYARMAGLLPAIAHYAEATGEAVPVDTTLARANWMGHAGTWIRGYRNPCWEMEPLGNLPPFLSQPENAFDMMGTFQTIASLVEIHFGTQANLLNHFFYPHMPTPPNVDPWREC